MTINPPFVALLTAQPSASICPGFAVIGCEGPIAPKGCRLIRTELQPASLSRRECLTWKRAGLRSNGPVRYRGSPQSRNAQRRGRLSLLPEIKEPLRAGG